MSEQSDDIQWYIARDGKQHGPLTEVEMRTFVAHSYLRPTDLIWRPGLPEWQAAPEVFPAVFNPSAGQQPAAAKQPQSYGAPSAGYNQAASAQSAQPYSNTPASADAYVAQNQSETDAAGRTSPRRRLAIAAAAVAVIGGGAFALAQYRDPLMQIVGAGPEQTIEIIAAPKASGEAPESNTASVETTATPPEQKSVDEPSSSTASDPVQTAAVEPASPATTATDAGPDAAPAPTAPAVSAPAASATAALSPTATAPEAPPSIAGSAIDAKLSKIPAWGLIKQDYPDWYVGHIAAAEKLAAENKPESEIAMHLAQGLVNLRRQNSDKALAASPEKLRKIATAFLDNLRMLRTQSVSACYGFISKGETSPAVVQLMQTPESATAFNTQISAVFEAISEGSKTPVKHDPAVKADYDILIKELGKLGWKEEDLQVFSNPRLLAKREPDRVCKMVQDWFVAHLAVPDKPARDRLLYETLKPVVSG